MGGVPVPDSPAASVEQLRRQYDELRPLFDYLKTRLKYDTVRWIRTVGAKDDVVFSTRVKSFDRIYDKLRRKRVSLPRNFNLLEQIISEGGILDDVVAIRFVCFDHHQIIRLVSNFITTQRVKISNPSYYLWPRSDADAPVYRFLRANGFAAQSKVGREYEDVNFIMRFAHPIDLYFRSGVDSYTALQEIDREKRLARRDSLTKIFETLQRTHTDWITKIPQFPIECQIATATQHLYNRVQRPLYEHVIQSKEPGAPLVETDVSALEKELTGLKVILSAADHLSHVIAEKHGVRYDFYPQISPAEEFGVEGRLPPDILGKNAEFAEINNTLLASAIAPGTYRTDRARGVKALLGEHLNSFDEAIVARARSHDDILGRSLADLSDLPNLQAPSIMFWAHQRIYLLFLCTLLLYTNDEKVNARILGFLNERAPPGGLKYGSDRIAMTALFERLMHMDSAVATALSAVRRSDGIKLDPKLFTDPLIAWRYASMMYKLAEYGEAKDKLELGLSLWDSLIAREETPPFKLPERELFIKRIVDYEICIELGRSSSSPTAVPAMLEVCRLLAVHSERWLENLEISRGGATEQLEQARALCLQLLIRLCTVSSGGIDVRVGLEESLGQYGQAFADLSKRLDNENNIRNRSWWLLCEAATGDAWGDALNKFDDNMRENKRHPREKKEFEELCANLIRMWRAPSASAGEAAFASSVLERLQLEVDSLKNQHAVAQEMRALAQLVAEAREELRVHGVVTTEKKAGFSKRLKERAIDAGEKIVVDTVVAGVRAVIGF